MTEISQWLEERGFGEYAGLFAENRIDLDVLPDLDAEDLKDLGVPLGDRKRLLKAARALKSEQAELPSGQTSPSPTGLAERRQLTVMFCDLVGSTAISAQLDPEDLRDLNRAYQDATTAAITRFDGYVARYMGDGVLAYFGYPRAHEDDAQRAVLAGLGVVEAMHALNARTAREQGIELAVRVGIATGPVVVGDLIGEGSSQETAVVGETPNLAARLQGLAPPGAVVIAETTHRLTGGRFTYEDLGPQSLKGVTEPVRAWRVVDQTPTQSRFELSRGAELTPLVDREHEVGLLRERWAQACEGEGQVVLIAGEAGIGKSRISQALGERVVSESRYWIRYQCSPYHTNSALHPVIENLERACGFGAEDSPAMRLDKMEAFLRAIPVPLETHAPLIAPLLSLTAGNRYAPLRLAPERQKARTLDALVEQVTRFSLLAPVLVLFEDAHWADPSSIELLDRMVEAAERFRMILIITFRPEFNSHWSAHTHVTSLTLNRLSGQLVANMVDEVAAGKVLPLNLREQIVSTTDGIPLFVEELTKSILESVSPDDEDPSRVAPPVKIPETLHDSLMARLDRLASMKEVAQQAAAIGREFSRDLLAAISALPEEELDDALLQLIDAGLVFTHGDPPRYVFKHALVQQAAYESMLRRSRQQLHARIAETIEEKFSKTVETEPELLAEHYSQAGIPDKAVAYWRRAGERAARNASHAEAVAHFARGLELARTLPESIERAGIELGLSLPLVDSLRVVDRCREALEVLDRAQAAASAHAFDERLAEIHHQRGNIRFPFGDAERCLQEHRLALEYSRRANSVEIEARALGGIGDAYYLEGRMRSARDYFSRCVSLCRRNGLKRTEAANLHMVGWARIHLFEFAQAREDAKKTIALATEMEHHRAELLGWMLIGLVHTHASELDEARHVLDRALALSQRLGAGVMETRILTDLALLDALRGNRAEGRRRMGPVLERLRRSGRHFFGPLALGTLARIALDEEERREALAEGESILSEGCVGHNYYWFYRDAIEATLESGWWMEAERYASALESYVRDEPVPWGIFFARRARLLSAHGRGERGEPLLTEARELRDEAVRVQLMLVLPALDGVLGT